MTTAPVAAFPRLDKSGWLLGLTIPQLLWVGAGAAALMSSITRGIGSVVLTVVFVTVPLVLFGILSRHGRPLVTWAWVGLVFAARRMVGVTTWKVAPESLATEVGTWNIPGAVGTRVRVVKVPYGDNAGVLIDQGRKVATVVIRCEQGSFLTASSDEQHGRAYGFARLASQVLSHDGVVRLSTMARTLPAANEAAIEYYTHQAQARSGGVDASSWAHDQAMEALESEGVDVTRDVLVTVSVDLRAVRAHIKAAGGGIQGIGMVMAREVVAVSKLLDGCGVRNQRWLTPTEVAAAVRVAYDPAAIDAIDARRVSGVAPVNVEDAGPVVVIEEWDRLRTDSSVHQTWWIHQWPLTEVGSGFLTSLIAEGQYARTITQVFVPEPSSKTAKKITDQRLAAQSKIQVNEKLKRPTSLETIKTIEDLDEQEDELTAGFAGIRFTGYVTVHAPNDDALVLAASQAQLAADGLDLRLLSGQQAAAFNAGSLPLGWGLK